MDDRSDPIHSELIALSTELRARSHDMCEKVAETRQRAREAVARARQIQLAVANGRIVRPVGDRTRRNRD